ncbi:MAG: hypothetical protein HGB26_06275 [Desulfobulbaceae bacterium]|jgi:hypothetical protein|nr:hypothetical protein [Desulfobulbaceae bacterium]
MPSYKNRYFPEIKIDYKSDSEAAITSDKLLDIKDNFVKAAIERENLNSRIRSKDELVDEYEKQLAKIIWIPFAKFLFKKRIQLLEEKIQIASNERRELIQELSKCFISIRIDFESRLESAYKNLVTAYRELTKCDTIWDIASSQLVDRIAMRSIASNLVDRKRVFFGFKDVEFVSSTHPAFHLQNANGSDIYLYPSFLLLLKDRWNFALIDIREIKISSHESTFVENERVPSDTKIIAQTWAKANKDGSPDKRFNDNYQIPVVIYGGLHFKSEKGLNELYSFSNANKPTLFKEAFDAYINALS